MRGSAFAIALLLCFAGAACRKEVPPPPPPPPPTGAMMMRGDERAISTPLLAQNFSEAVSGSSQEAYTHEF